MASIPTRLAFASAPQVIGTGACSAQISIETRNAADQPAPVTVPTTVFFNAVPMGVTIYLGPACLGAPVTLGTIPPAQSVLRFSVRSSTANSYTLTASSMPLSAATQPLVVFQTPTQLAFSATLPNPLRAGSCLAATVEARGPTSLPVAVQSATLVALTTNVSNGTLFFADPMCSLQIAVVPIGVGSSSATLYVKPLSGVPQVLSATAPFGTGTLAISPVPIVRRGDCTVQGSAEQCPIDTSAGPVIPATSGRSFLITQSIGGMGAGSAVPIDVEARCRLQGSEISCSRRGNGLTRHALTHFQVVELPTGLTVQAASSGNCSGSINLLPMVDPTRTFLLKSVVGVGSNFDQDDAVSVTLAGPAQATLSSNACEGYDVQAVQWDGVSVTRGQSTILSGAFSSMVNLPSSSPSTLVLSQPSNDATFPVPPCLVLGRAEVFSPSELRFSRGSNRSSCNIGSLPRIVWERIDFGSRARVWAYPATLTMNTQTFSIPITPVDPTRSFVITSSQQLGGQGSGESDALGTSDAVDSAVQTRLINATSVTANSVEVVRQASSSAVTVTIYVVQIEP